MADNCLEHLDNQNSPEFVPQRWTKVYRDWLVKLQDWCISRQLWWGHQIPAWYAVSESGGEITDNTPYFVAKNEAEAKEQAIAQFGVDVQLVQDPDVLDTWFSSGIWPFSTLGWPEETADLEMYYPTSTLVTGFDIIFFWVARMTMMSGYLTGKMPFKDVYIHGLVLDENGKKMSKSANNGIDPLLLIDKYGTDALRYTLIREVVGAGQDIRIQYNRKTDESESVEASRNFTNKIWNAARFVMINLEEKTPQQWGTPDRSNLEVADRWILSRFHQTAQQTGEYIDRYALGEAAKGLYEFFWGDLCDWYIELVKSRLLEDADPTSKLVTQQTLAFVLDGILKLIHPFMPHVTSEIWQTFTQSESPLARLEKGGTGDISIQPYPIADISLIDTELDREFELLIGVTRTIRNLRAEAELKRAIKVAIIIQSDSEQERQTLERGRTYLCDLAQIEELTIVDRLATEPERSIASVFATVQIILPLTGVVDLEAFKAKIQKKIDKIDKEIESIHSRLNNTKFMERATPEVVQQTKDSLTEAEKQKEILQERLEQF
jgi:valyl-tRNA synthetase